MVVRIDRGIFSRTNVFSWWESTFPESLDLTRTTTPLRLTDQQQNAALVDHEYGEGRVVFLAVAADADWSDWPSSPTFIVVMFDMIREMVDRVNRIPVVTVGEPLLAPVDIGRFRPLVKLLGPNQQQWETTARPARRREDSATTGDPADSPGTVVAEETSQPQTDQTRDTVFYEAEFEPLPDRGFYEVELQPTAQTESVQRWYACNGVAEEGDLKLVSLPQLQQWMGERVEVVPLGLVSQQSVNVARDEFWFQVLLGLLAVLGLEQFLACWFGTRRS